jgi:hypothetical protein
MNDEGRKEIKEKKLGINNENVKYRTNRRKVRERSRRKENGKRTKRGQRVKVKEIQKVELKNEERKGRNNV